jgi:dCMP deaminase
LASGIVVNDTFWSDRDARRPYMIHAETNLLSLFKRGECKLLACTLLPCSSCATMIASYDIKKVIYSETYHQDNKALDIFKFYGITCEQYKI